MKLFAISDLHLRYPETRRALAEVPDHGDDWLIVAGDLGEDEAHFHYTFQVLGERFGRLIWVPGNHDLWTPPTASPGLRGEAKYRRLVAICRQYGVLTPEDPYPHWPDPRHAYVLAPVFVLYDYSFRPEEVSAEQVLAWAAEENILCADEALLHPDPYPDRASWCAARCALTEDRLAHATAGGQRVVLINHYPLRRDLVRLRRIPRFSPWCGTRRTETWPERFGIDIVVYGHLHIRGTHVRDGVRHEEVSLGYPRDWDVRLGVEPYLRQILPSL